MAFIKKQDVETLRKAHALLVENMEYLMQDDLQIVADFSNLLDKIDDEKEALTVKARENMRKYRSTPEGREKDRIRQKKANHNYYQKKKAEREKEKGVQKP